MSERDEDRDEDPSSAWDHPPADKEHTKRKIIDVFAGMVVFLTGMLGLYLQVPYSGWVVILGGLMLACA